jgi:hypothetical protein
LPSALGVSARASRANAGSRLQDGTWTTSTSWELYAPPETLRFEICGGTYELESPYLERLREATRQASALAQSK